MRDGEENTVPRPGTEKVQLRSDARRTATPPTRGADQTLLATATLIRTMTRTNYIACLNRMWTAHATLTRNGAS